MKTRKIVFGVVLWILAATALQFAFSQTASGTSLRFGVLEDQHGRTWDLNVETSKGSAVLIFSNQRDGDRKAHSWLQALTRELPGWNIIVVLSLKGVPFFVPKASVVNQIRKTSQTPILLDWEGGTGDILSAPGNQTSIYVFRDSGAPILAAKGPVSETGIRAVIQAAGTD